MLEGGEVVKCNHQWINADDGSLDKICTICCKRAMQAVMALPVTADIMLPNTHPITRETITIHMGGDLGNVKVYKDELLEEINKSFKIQMGRR